MSLKFYKHTPYFGWGDYEANMKIKILPNISIEFFSLETDPIKLGWFVRLEWIIFSIRIDFRNYKQSKQEQP